MSIFALPAASLRTVRLAGILAGASLLATALVPLAPAFAHEYKVGTIVIEHPWSRATPPAAKTGAGYMTLSNTGTQPDRLLSITSPAASKVEAHDMAVTDGIMRMKPMEGGVEIPAGGSVALQPGGNHLMLMGLSKPLVEGEKVPLTLTFEKAGSVEVELAVDKIGAPAPAAAGMPGAHDMHKMAN